MTSGIDIMALQQMFEDVATNKEEEEQGEPFEQVIEPQEKDTFWDEGEITPVGFYKDPSDNRPEPEYTIHYRQQVGTEDVYLGLNMVDPSISSADEAVIKVKLPDTAIDDIDLNVQNGYLDLRAPKYRLALKMDYPTKDGDTKAKWNNDEKELTIEIPLVKAGLKLV